METEQEKAMRILLALQASGKKGGSVKNPNKGFGANRTKASLAGKKARSRDGKRV